MSISNLLTKKIPAGCWGLVPVIPVTWKAKVGRIEV
jgi:hypothetical protein